MRKINPYSVLFQSNLFYIFTTLIITTLLILLPQKKSFSQVPDIEWQKSFGGSSTDEVKCIIQTKDGGYIFAGWTHSNDFDVIGSYGQVTADCWIVKTDPLGNIQWQRVIGGTQDDIALSIKQTLDGGYIIGGHSSSGDGDLTKNYGNSMDALVIKLDPQGNIEWLKNLGGNEYDVIISIELTSDGGFICAGYTGSNTIDVSGLHGDYDAWIVKLDQDGDIQWQKCIGGKERDVAWSIKQTTDGGYVFTGHTRSSDGDILINQGDFDIFVCKLNAAGNIEWLKTIGGSANDWGLDINCTPDGGYIIAGYTFSGNGDVTTNFGMNDIWIIKLNEAGNIQWQKSYGGSDYDDPYSIELTTDGGYVVAGRTRSADGDVTLNNGDNDYWVLKLDVNGALQWQKTVGGSEQEVAHSIKQTLDGGFIIAGASLSDNGDVTYNRGISDIWVVKLGDCKLKTPDIPGKITGNISPCIGTLVTYSINAVNEATGYTWSFPIGWDIFSGQGTSQITVTAGTTSGNINVFAYNSCKSSDNQTITVTPVTEQPPQIVIAANSGNEICEGTLVVFTAQTSGATSPVYQWKKNGISVGQNSSIYNDNNLANGDIISCHPKFV